ncbi:alpha/beta fold hydrolase [Streptomyces triticagri]|uniref:Alpha/beta fold hydrolase n=1 Tax=Streptomyces triticagri TaxID=2293568 RepID=A0A372MB09_9ACTN|nr:alpha/beta fold hydrolase [Streptomyces triticagri]RFU88132.1 alpha/beta fold hydrolase [Streptomyces triticagri]
MSLLRAVAVNGTELNVAVTGSGPPVLLLHGFPHTWKLWTDIMAGLSGQHRLIAPDLRGFGASGRPVGGYDAGTLADDIEALLTALDVPTAAVVGIDAGAAPAFLFALRRPERVRGLVVMEAVLGGLPGAEDFAASPPWWFGFHSVPGLAETVLQGQEEHYIDWFLGAGTLGQGVRPSLRDAFVAAYTGRAALRSAFSYYRALPESAEQIARAVAAARLVVPTLAVGAHPVERALERQLAPIADDLTGHVIEDCGHIIPLHRPRELLALLAPFLRDLPTD